MITLGTGYRKSKLLKPRSASLQAATRCLDQVEPSTTPSHRHHRHRPCVLRERASPSSPYASRRAIRNMLLLQHLHLGARPGRQDPRNGAARGNDAMHSSSMSTVTRAVTHAHLPSAAKHRRHGSPLGKMGTAVRGAKLRPPRRGTMGVIVTAKSAAHHLAMPHSRGPHPQGMLLLSLPSAG